MKARIKRYDEDSPFEVELKCETDAERDFLVMHANQIRGQNKMFVYCYDMGRDFEAPEPFLIVPGQSWKCADPNDSSVYQWVNDQEVKL